MISPKKKPLNQFLKFSNLAFQMGLIIGLATFAGIKMDLYFKLENIFTIIFALIGVFGALFFVINEAKKTII